MSCADPFHCVTCADEGVAMRVVAVDDGRGLALCETTAGARETVEIALVEPVAPATRCSCTRARRSRMSTRPRWRREVR